MTAPSREIGFSDITSQGMPFYGGNLTYKTEIETDACNLSIRVSRYRGAAVRVFVDGEDKGLIAFSPYTLKVNNLKKGKHIIEFKVFGNRINTFGSLHACDYNKWFGPNKWYTYKEKSQTEQKCKKVYSSKWCYEYTLKPAGVLASPVIMVEEI